MSSNQQKNQENLDYNIPRSSSLVTLVLGNRAFLDRFVSTSCTKRLISFSNCM